ncbi:MAG: BatA domain-containing protein [Isosphaerales bacterium]
MTFAAPFFLFAALAGLVPVVIHLIHRRKAREIRFSTLRFLRLSVRKTRRRKYLDDVLLLMARVAVLVLIALGLSRPAVSGLRALLGGGKGLAVALVVDNSASMGQTDDGRPRFETARRAAEQVLASHREGDPIALLFTGGPPDPVEGRLHHSHEAVRQRLAQAKPSYERADLAARLREARKLVDQADTAAREIYVITDNQALAWEGLKAAKENDSEANAPKRGEAPVVVVNVRRDPMLNVALQDVRLQSPAPATGVPVRVSAEVLNASPVPQQKHLELFLDGARQGVSPTLTLPAGGTVRYEFRVVPERGGVHKGEVRLAEDDASPLDNRLYFAVTVDQQVPVAVIKPRRQEVPYAEDSFYLERALAPDGPGTGAMRVVSVTPDEAAGKGAGAVRSLAEFAVVYAVNLRAPDTELAVRLRTYVHGGGHLVWVCGENVESGAYNWMNSLAQGELLPAPLEPAQKPAGPEGDGVPIGFLDKDYPPFAPLTEPASLYRSVLVYQYVPMTWGPRSTGRVLARLDQGQPLLVELGVGAGSVLLLGTGMTADWTNLPLKPLFLPLFARLTFHLAGAETARPPVIAGSPAVIPLGSGPARASEVEVVRPSGELIRLRPQEADGPTLRYADTHDVGVYLFRLGRNSGPRGEKQVVVAVNIDPGESDPATLSREELQARFGPHPLVYCERPEDLSGAIHQLREGTNLWEGLLAAVLAALVLEAFLANGSAAQTPEATVDAHAQATTPAPTPQTAAPLPPVDNVMDYLSNL